MTTGKNLISAKEAIQNIKGHLYFGEMVRSLRMCEEISQVKMAQKIGVSKQYLCNIENGERKADVNLAIKFSQVFNHPQEFFVSKLLEDQLYAAGLDYNVDLKAS